MSGDRVSFRCVECDVPIVWVDAWNGGFWKHTEDRVATHEPRPLGAGPDAGDSGATIKEKEA